MALRINLTEYFILLNFPEFRFFRPVEFFYTIFYNSLLSPIYLFPHENYDDSEKNKKFMKYFLKRSSIDEKEYLESQMNFYSNEELLANFIQYHVVYLSSS